MKNDRKFKTNSMLNRIMTLKFRDEKQLERFKVRAESLLEELDGENITATSLDLMYSDQSVKELNDKMVENVLCGYALKAVSLLNLDTDKYNLSVEVYPSLGDVEYIVTDKETNNKDTKKINALKGYVNYPRLKSQA